MTRPADRATCSTRPPTRSSGSPVPCLPPPPRAVVLSGGMPLVREAATPGCLEALARELEVLKSIERVPV